MSILWLLIPLALILAFCAVGAFLWAVNHGEFEDMQTPALRMLHDDVLAPTPSKEHTAQP